MKSIIPFGTAGYQPDVAEIVSEPRFAARSMNSRRLLAASRPGRPKPLSREDFDTLLALADKEPSGQDLIDIATLIYFTGLRTGELATLLWKHVDFKKRQLLIHGCAT